MAAVVAVLGRGIAVVGVVAVVRTCRGIGACSVMAFVPGTVMVVVAVVDARRGIGACSVMAFVPGTVMVVVAGGVAFVLGVAG